MTNEEIEAARERLVEFLDDVYNEAPELDTDEPMGLIDALCAAAREPESLVGKRVKSNNHINGRYQIGKIARGPYWHVHFDDVRLMQTRDYFELLEGDDAE